jgi:hypothetical protein
MVKPTIIAQVIERNYSAGLWIYTPEYNPAQAPLQNRACTHDARF